MVPSVRILKWGQRYVEHVFLVSEFFRVFHPIFLKAGTCPDFTNFWQKMSRFRF
jgi:hypothetical protein